MDDRESFKTGAPNFFYFYHGSNKMRTTSTSREIKYLYNIFSTLFYIFVSTLHLMPFAGKALVFPAPSYVNVKVMDVWRGRRVNRWLVDGQHFITWSRGRRGAEMLPSVTSEGENTQITPALSTQMDNIYIPTQLLLSSQQTSLHHHQARSRRSDENRRTISGESRSEDLS